MNTVKEETTRLDDKILELSCMSDQIGAIAQCATTLRAAEDSMLREDLMHGIVSLSGLLSDKLHTLADVVEGVTV